MSWRLALGVLLAAGLAVACATEGPSEDGELLAEQRPGDGQGPAAGPSGSGAGPPPGPATAGEQPPAGAGVGGGAPAAWTPPRADCEPRTPSIYYTGILLDMTSGEATCSRQILVCGDTVRTDRRYNYNQGERCPWGEGPAIAHREDGMPVCCEDWDRAKVSKSPCDPLADADCDGTPNDEDLETLNASPLPTR